MVFNCTKCGLCCSNIKQAIEFSKQKVKTGKHTQFEKELSEFPYSYNESGRCENLTENNMCKIYEKRPDICNLQKVHEKYYASIMNKEDFLKANENSCLELQNI